MTRIWTVVAIADAPAGHTRRAGARRTDCVRRYFDDRQTTGPVFTINPDGSHEQQLTHPPAGALDDQPARPPDTRD